MFTIVEGTLVSLPVLRDRYRANNVNLLDNVQNKSVLPGVLKSFEDFFDKNNYVYTRPMTDAEFREYSNNPIEVEQYKTAYTNHWLEYNKIKSQYENIDKTIQEFVDANRLIGKYFWKAVANTLVGSALVLWLALMMTS